MKKALSTFLALCMAVSLLPSAALAAEDGGLTQAEAEAAVAALNAKAGSDFYYELVDDYADSEIEYRTEVRWWMAEGGHTDQTLEEEVRAMYDAGFRGVELCQLNESSLDASVYGYGSEQWNHDFHVVLNKALDLGMTVGITSGTNWNTTNVPGLDPDSQAAMQGVFATSELVEGGASISGPAPREVLVAGSFGAPDTMQPVRDENTFIGAYAFRVIGPDTQMALGEEVEMTRLDSASCIDLTGRITIDANGQECLDWTAPDDGDYYVFFYWQQGTAQQSSPSVEPSYCVNYFDIRGFEAFKEYFSANVLNDPELNKKIKNGDVQLFMDSLEISRGNCVTYWTEDFADEFMARKGYDIRPYLFMNIGLPAESELARWSPLPAEFGTFCVETDDLGTKIFNDLRDVQTQLYMENLLEPMEEWLNEYNISLRAQISYGRYFEISEPTMAVDYPEAENLNQRNQVDIYRLWTGAAKLENKILSSETGALGGMGYSYDHQRHLQEAYALYAAGFSRINWHVWTSSWSPESITQNWPGFQSLPFGPGFNPNFNVLGTREPEYATYWAFNQHLGRIQKLLRQGVSRTDVGMLYLKYDQHIAAQCLAEDDMWMQRHDYMLFPSTELQENGYTYDYFSPAFLEDDAVSYNAETGTLEQAGYKALVLWQNWLSLDSAQELLDLARQGMKIVVVDGAAVETPYDDGQDEALAQVMEELKGLDNVATAATADDVMEALESLGVEPYAGFVQRNQQLLTQVRQDGDNRYMYVYNYCDGSLHDGDDPDHGTHATVDIELDGMYLPYQIDAWTGEVTQLAQYRYEDGKTVITVDLDYGNVALYAFEAVDSEDVHVVSADQADALFTTADGAVILRATESGTYTATLSDGTAYTNTLVVAAPYDITGWDLIVEAWSASDERLTRTDTYTDSKGNTSVEYTYDTVKTDTTVHLDKLTTWDRIPEIGQGASGTGHYTAQFNWDGQADGAYLDFGSLVNSMKVYINGVQTADLNMNQPVLDITEYLVPGVNTIELDYYSNLANELLETGVLTAGNAGWAGYDIEYRSYGPTQAVIIPYAQVDITDEVALYFTDVGKDSPYAGAVAALTQQGVIKGVGQTKFRPETVITVAELATFLGRMDGAAVDDSAAAAGLTADGWSAGYVAWAREKGFVGGQAQYAPLTTEEVNAALAAFCASRGATAVTAQSASRGDVVAVLSTL